MGRNRNNVSDSAGSPKVNLAEMIQGIDKRLEVKESVDKARHVELSKKLECVIKENSELKERVGKMEKIINAMQQEIFSLKSDLNNVYQDKISNNVVIKNVPEINGKEDFRGLFNLLVKRTGIPVQQSYFIDGYRMGKKIEGKKRPIVIKLCSNKYKNEILSAKRKVKIYSHTILQGACELGTPEEEIYMDEHLTRTNMNLFMQARRLKSHGIKFIWTRNGKVLIKAKEGAATIVVTCVDQLADVLRKDVPTGTKRKDISTSTEIGSPNVHDEVNQLHFDDSAFQVPKRKATDEPMEIIEVDTMEDIVKAYEMQKAAGEGH